MPNRYNDYSSEDFIDRIEDLEEQVLMLTDYVDDLSVEHSRKTWIEEFVSEVKTYLDWRRDPNAYLSPEAQKSVETTMLSLLETKMNEISQ